MRRTTSSKFVRSDAISALARLRMEVDWEVLAQALGLLPYVGRDTDEDESNGVTLRVPMLVPDDQSERAEFGSLALGKFS